MADTGDPEGIPAIVDGILEQGLAAGASDIHIEPGENGSRVRMRVDGVFRENGGIGKPVSEGVANRLKVMSRLAVHRNDIPQEGAFVFRNRKANNEVEMRISVMPVVAGEKIVIRFFDVLGRIMEIGELGFSAEVVAGLETLVMARDGLYLVCGPSGSGKTTTIYALLKEIVRRRGERVNVVSLEDPVERVVPGVNQTGVNPDRGLDYAAGLRALMRQDPEVIAVAEIRDAETAMASLRASFTGHLVVSTMHCGRAAEAVRRLVDLGLPVPLIATSLRGVLAQRLVRVICPGCRGKGCADCRNTGYQGRTAFGEYLDAASGRVHEVIGQTALPDAIEKAGVEAGMTTLETAGRKVWQAGTTSEKEVMAVL